MAQDQPPLPDLWLLSDRRNDAGLEQALAALPGGSGFIYRHYHLEEQRRQARYRELATVAKEHGHCVILSTDGWNRLDDWGGDGMYGGLKGTSGPPPPEYLWLATAHNGDEIQEASRIGADAVMLSPVFSTRSRPDAPILGPFGFSVLAQQADIPVIALGGMTRERAEEYGIQRWAAIDGLS